MPLSQRGRSVRTRPAAGCLPRSQATRGYRIFESGTTSAAAFARRGGDAAEASKDWGPGGKENEHSSGLHLIAARLPCQGRPKSGPLTPVEKWTTLSSVGGACWVCRGAEPGGRGGAVNRASRRSRGRRWGVLRPAERGARRPAGRARGHSWAWSGVFGPGGRKRGVQSRSVALGGRAATHRSGDFGRFGGWRAAEVLVLEPVGVALEVEDLGVVDEPVDHGGGDDVVAEGFAPARGTACSR
jgi:hypothetical protein